MFSENNKNIFIFKYFRQSASSSPWSQPRATASLCYSVFGESRWKLQALTNSIPFFSSSRSSFLPLLRATWALILSVRFFSFFFWSKNNIDRQYMMISYSSAGYVKTVILHIIKNEIQWNLWIRKGWAIPGIWGDKSRRSRYWASSSSSLASVKLNFLVSFWRQWMNFQSTSPLSSFFRRRWNTRSRLAGRRGRKPSTIWWYKTIFDFPQTPHCTMRLTLGFRWGKMRETALKTHTHAARESKEFRIGHCE